jgi:hypothetical protein
MPPKQSVLAKVDARADTKDEDVRWVLDLSAS